MSDDVYKVTTHLQDKPIPQWTDAEKLRLVAAFFTAEQEKGRWPEGDTSVQEDLLRMADRLEVLDKESDETSEVPETSEAVSPDGS